MTEDSKTTPPFYGDLPALASVWNYRPHAAAISAAAIAGRRERIVTPAANDSFRTELLLIDMQRDFCHPMGSLYVGGRSRTGAVDDVQRVTNFVYSNINNITRITPTMDTHVPLQIFFTSFWRKEDGSVPDPFTVITADDVRKGRYAVSPDVATCVPHDVFSDGEKWAERQARHYVEALEKSGRYSLILWPYHCVAGTEGHALAGPVQEAILYHALARGAANAAVAKGENPWTENYSVFGPEVNTRWDDGADLIRRNYAHPDDLMAAVMRNDAVIIAGEAASHCVMSSVDDLLAALPKVDPKRPARLSNIYILRDCMSAVVTMGADGKPIPGLDFTQNAEDALRRWEDLGAHIVESTVPMKDWPGFPSNTPSQPVI